MATLRCAEDAARAPNLQVAHGNAKTRTERTVLLDGIDPFTRGADRHHFARKKQIGISFVLSPADASPQLIKIGQTKPVSAIDDDRVGVWDVEAAFDNCGANKHIDFPGNESRHDGFEFIGPHLAMPDFHSRLRTEIDNAVTHALDGLDTIVQEENLTLALQFTIDGIANNSFIISGDHCLDGQPVEWRRFDRGHVLHTHQGQVKSARNRRGGER